MIELPEAKVLATQLHNTLKGKIITSVQVGQSPHKFTFFHNDSVEYNNLLLGNQFEAVYTVGGWIECVLGNTRLAFFDGVNPRLVTAKKELPKKHQLCLGFADDSFLVCTVQMYGGILAFQAGELEDNKYYKIAKEKPDVLSEKFTENYFLSIVKESKKTLSLKGLLATEQRIPGLGNGTLQDIYFFPSCTPKEK